MRGFVAALILMALVCIGCTEVKQSGNGISRPPVRPMPIVQNPSWK